MNPQKMALLKDADTFAQIACPRLSIDWGEDFQKPVIETICAPLKQNSPFQCTRTVEAFRVGWHSVRSNFEEDEET